MENKMSHIRKMTNQDIPAVREIEMESFSTPWSEEAFFNELANPNAHYYVWENEKIIAYAGFWLVLDEAGITNIAVRKSERGKGIGQQLVAFLRNEAEELGALAITLEVRESNVPAIAVYQKNGFYPVGIRKDYYTKPTENALIMWAKPKKEDSHEHGTKSD